MNVYIQYANMQEKVLKRKHFIPHKGLTYTMCSYGRVTIMAKNRVVGHPVQQNVLYIKMFGIVCSI